MTDITRRDFEVECRRYWWPERCPDLDYKDGKYESGRAQLAWAFYQAATLAEREHCASLLEKLTAHKRMVRAAINGVKPQGCEYATAIRRGGEA